MPGMNGTEMRASVEAAIALQEDTSDLDNFNVWKSLDAGETLGPIDFYNIGFGRGNF